MKLNKLYCNNNDFKVVMFKEELNIIVGYGNKLSENDSHNLGKTSVIKLIDYMLLKDISRDPEHFLSKKKEFFKDYTFFLEIEYGEGLYLTIKREVKNTKVSLKKHNLKHQNFIEEKNWDFENISINKAKKEVNNLLEFSVKSNFRKFLKFILRTQKDYDFKFKKNEVKDIDWKPYIMELFGYNFDNYNNLFKFKSEKEEIEKQLSEYNDDYFEELNEKRNMKDIYETKINELEKLVKEYNCFKIDDTVNDELVKQINCDIAKLNKKKYNLSFDIENMKKSIKNNMNTLDLEDLEEIYKEVKIYFGDFLKKDYNSLIEFNKQISKERIDNLKNILFSKEKELEEINALLEEKNKEQKKLFKILETNKTFEKVLFHNDELNKYKLRYTDLANELKYMESNIKKNQELKEKINKINELISKVNSEMESNENLLKQSILDKFSYYTKRIFFDSEGKISIYLNKDGFPAIDMKLYSTANGEVTAEDSGNNYNKHIKCCFDLSVIIGYIENKKKYFNFVFHDGSIEASDNKLKIAYINLIKDLCKEFKIQYITTTIYDEIAQKDVFEKIDEKNIILKLNDAEDYSGTLFGKRF